MFYIYLILLLLFCQNACAQEVELQKPSESETVSEKTVPEKALRLIRAYPDLKLEYEDNHILFSDGTSMIYDDEGKEIPGKLRGEVSFNNIKFSYDKDGSYVLNGIDLKIAQGEYVGIVGSSGCGKSTLLKLLLGFEEPDQGQVCFDGKNLKQLDKREVRKNLGVVLQNGKLIAGSIFFFFSITAPSATLKDVQAVIEAVGLKSDIEQMPMGVHTVLSENSGTISGGQQQRILIARAIIAHPSILIFDEATSALDNVTQAAVCESLDKMNVTRIVVAHRLSTIKNCDRIIVLQDGKIVEQGTYTALMDQNGLFHQLAARQLVD